MNIRTEINSTEIAEQRKEITQALRGLVSNREWIRDQGITIESLLERVLVLELEVELLKKKLES